MKGKVVSTVVIDSDIYPKCTIGIIAKHYKEGSKYPEGNQYSYSSDDLSSAVADNGAIPILIPSISRHIIYADNNTDWDNLVTSKEKEVLINQIKLCKGIILQGGVESDAYEIFVARYCYENNIPIIGICAGQNNMVRALGGKNKPVQDLEKHNRDFGTLAHMISIEPNTRLFKMLNGVNTLKVNSIHTNVIDYDSIKNLPFIVSAWDCFGNIEAVEIPDKPYLAIRFHPEAIRDNPEVGKIMNGFFKEFIKICTKVREFKGENSARQ